MRTVTCFVTFVMCTETSTEVLPSRRLFSHPANIFFLRLKKNPDLKRVKTSKAKHIEKWKSEKGSPSLRNTSLWFKASLVWKNLALTSVINFLGRKSKQDFFVFSKLQLIQTPFLYRGKKKRRREYKSLKKHQNWPFPRKPVFISRDQHFRTKQGTTQVCWAALFRQEWRPAGTLP